MGIQSQVELDFEKELVDYKNQAELLRDKSLADHEAHYEIHRLNLGAVYTYVSDGTKTAFLLNGAAAIGLMTFIGNFRATQWPAVSVTLPLATFALGAVLAVVTLLVAYISQSFFALMNVERKQRSVKAEVFQVLGLGTFIGSVLLFVLGLVRTGEALGGGAFSFWSIFGP